MKILIGCEESQAVCKTFRAKGHEAYSCDILPCSGGHPEWHLQMDVFKAIKLHKWDMGIFFPDCTYLTCSAEWAYKDGPYHQKVKPETLVGEKRRLAREKALHFVRDLMNCDIPHISIENPIGKIPARIFWYVGGENGPARWEVSPTDLDHGGRSPDQILQPWQFGDNASKGTCLWLKNLPTLWHTNIIAPKDYSLIRSAVDMIECPDCEEPYCGLCDCHYADCECLGPTQDDVIYKTISGFMFGTLRDPAPRPVWANQTPSGQNNLGPSDNRAKLRSKTYPGIAQAMADQWTDFYIKQILKL